MTEVLMEEPYLGLDLGNTIEVNAFYHLVIMDELNFGSAGLGLLFVF